MRRRTLLLACFVVLTLLVACAPPQGTGRMPSPAEIAEAVKLPTSTWKLDNGLTVIFHEDHSDPVVALAVLYHVGSSRETPGKTGLAHLFEHIMFQESENVGQDQFFKKIQAAGGTLNGFTFEDGTMYFEVVPKNALELIMWMESDRMGYLMGALDATAFFNQQGVVMNEKRQGVDNQPYGWRDYVVSTTLWPQGHPYSWDVIGSMTDLAHSSVDDAKAFFQRWYGPNNATLVLAGDFDPATAREWTIRYFGEIPAGPAVEDRKPVPAALQADRSVYYEDALATVPELSIVWPGAPAFSKDEAALDLLAQFLSEGKDAPLYKHLVMDKKLTREVEILHHSLELGGMFIVRVKPLQPHTLSSLLQEIDARLAELGDADFTERAVAKVKARWELPFYRRAESVFNKAMYLAFYNVFWGSPDRFDDDLIRYMSLTPADLRAAFNQYLVKKPRILVSVVPAGQSAAAVAGATAAPIPSDADAKPNEPPPDAAKPPRTPSNLDRSKEPASGASPSPMVPAAARHEFPSGLSLLSLERRELPMVELSLDMPGGVLATSGDMPGLAWVTASMLDEGTANKTPVQLQEELDLLGCSLTPILQNESVQIRGACPVRNVAAALDLLAEMLTQPRFDAEELERIRRAGLAALDEYEGYPSFLADIGAARALYGDSHPLSFPQQGTRDALTRLTMDDVKAFYARLFRPGCSVLAIAGALSPDEARATAARLADRWTAAEPCSPPLPVRVQEDRLDRVFFVDVPGAQQAQMRVAGPTLTRSHPDYYSTFVANYPLGGAFNSRLNMILREEKGVTYGARSAVSAGHTYGEFEAWSAVQSDAVGDALDVFRTQWSDARNGLSGEELAWTREGLSNSMAREYETLPALLEVLRNIGFFGLPADYLVTWRKTLDALTTGDAGRMVRNWMDPTRVLYLVAGDAAVILPQLEKLGWGEVIKLEKR